ncbi:discoidin domain-containing protein [Salipiger abyssi]|uniref:Uncharacterized protein n=1 Tax=Salipiger abyssi TaxID=1250539 RepID=A0A1P8V0L1_9RHOB|nr:discoidin domain-containing protein [Salipiger abyssi]APZ55190.1 hypothetical protein Ga0080574_TMP4908 [Salipiger abyssi]
MTVAGSPERDMLDMDDLIDVAARGRIHTAAAGEGAEHALWQIDLLQPLTLQSIAIAMAGPAPDRMPQLDVSLDAQNWHTVTCGTAPSGLAATGPLIARHVRLSGAGQDGLALDSVALLATRRDVILSDFAREKEARLLPETAGAAPGKPPYGLTTAGSPRDDSIAGLKIRRYGRFGNNLIQIVNAIYLARHLGVRDIVAPEIGLGGALTDVEKDGIRLISDSSPAADGLYLEGDFFRLEVFGQELKAGLTNVRQYEIAQKYIVPYLGLLDTPDEERRSRSSELVFHIRSGDIFSPNPHPGYVQPPLSYYTTILDDLRARGLIDRVCIVSEDRLNPCIGALEAHVAAQGLPLRMQSGTLAEDVGYLLGATHVVFGFGTFGYGICLLAENFASVHVFGMAKYGGLSNIGALKVLSTPPGEYIDAGQWNGKPEQLRKMLEFPAEKLLVSWHDGK